MMNEKPDPQEEFLKGVIEAGRQADAGTGASLDDRVIEVLKTCYDPEIPVNIYELGLVYEVKSDDGGNVSIRMTLTSPMCPVAESLPPEIQSKIKAIPGVESAKVEVVWDPPWTPAMMTEAAKLQLNMM
ncbi:MAG TPA: DUF59 domain-containing protein [Candidatus Polarisedimenticolia bacterium]|nr:DUF59 domain-containing protein [Candidatus Polarisedimenticolia bacterium]